MTSTLNDKAVTDENYGTIPLIQSKEKHDRQLLPIRDINETLVKQIVWIRGRLHTSRDRGNQCFFIIRHESATIQAIVYVNENVTKSMVKFVAE